MNVGPFYTVAERFDPSCGEAWNRYVAWSGLTQLSEVVSLDGLLCPRVIQNLLPEDWPHIVNEDFMTGYFTEVDYLVGRCGGISGRNLLCVFRNPDSHPSAPLGAHAFRFEGYELLDVHGDISALTNCGGLPLAFSNGELSDRGLLPTLERARDVRRALQDRYRAERHAECDVWAIFRAT